MNSSLDVKRHITYETDRSPCKRYPWCVFPVWRERCSKSFCDHRVRPTPFPNGAWSGRCRKASVWSCRSDSLWPPRTLPRASHLGAFSPGLDADSSRAITRTMDPRTASIRRGTAPDSESKHMRKNPQVLLLFCINFWRLLSLSPSGSQHHFLPVSHVTAPLWPH